MAKDRQKYQPAYRSASSSRWDDYSTLARSVLVPSFPILLSLCGAVLAAYEFHLGAGFELKRFTVPIACFIGSLTGIVPVYRKTLYGRHSNPTRKTVDALRFIVLLALTVSATAAGVILAGALCRTPVPPGGMGRWTAAVDEVTTGRYGARAEAMVSRGNQAAAVYRCLIMFGQEHTVKAGDVLIFSAAPRLFDGGNSRSATMLQRRRRGIVALFYLEGRTIEIIPSAPTIRDTAREFLTRTSDRLYEIDTAALIKGLYFGSMAYIEKSTITTFRHAGLMHALAASGDHVSVIAAIPLLVLGLMRVHRSTAMAITVAVLAAYLSITDMSVPLVRATLMFGLGTLYTIFHRERNMVNALFTAAIIVIIIAPWELFNIGFQLSFAATLGIIILRKPFGSALMWMPRPLAAALAMTAAAQVMVYPILFAHTGEINLVGIVAGLLVVPLIAVLLVSSIIMTALSSLISAGAALAVWVDVLYDSIAALARFFAGLNGHFTSVVPHPILIAAYLLMLAPLIPVTRGRRARSLFMAAGLALAWHHLASGTTPAPEYQRISHERGTLIIARRPGSAAFVGDLPGGTSLLEILKKIQLRPDERLDLFITRPNMQNIAGYRYLAEQVPVSRCFIADDFHSNGALRSLFRVLARDGVPVMTARVSDAAAQEWHPLLRRALEESEARRPGAAATGLQTKRSL